MVSGDWDVCLLRTYRVRLPPPSPDDTPQPIYEVPRFGLKSKTGLDSAPGEDLHPA